MSCNIQSNHMSAAYCAQLPSPNRIDLVPPTQARSIPQAASQPEARGAKAWSSSLRSTDPACKTLCWMQRLLSSLEDMASMLARVKPFPVGAVGAFVGADG